MARLDTLSDFLQGPEFTPKGECWDDDVVRLEMRAGDMLGRVRDTFSDEADVMVALVAEPGATFAVIPVVVPQGIYEGALPFLDAVLRRLDADAYLLFMSGREREHYAIYSGLARTQHAVVLHGTSRTPLDLHALKAGMRGCASFFGLGGVEEREHDAAVGDA